jgi:hypothetical protein
MAQHDDTPAMTPRPPMRLAGHHVVAWAWRQMTAGDGAVPNGIAIGFCPGKVPHEYAVWEVAWQNGDWSAGSGDYVATPFEAWKVFGERSRIQNAGRPAE